MPYGMPENSEQSMERTRAAFRVCGISLRRLRAYCSPERKSALRDLLLGLRSRSVICEDLGIDEKTVTALKDRFVSHFSDTVSSLASLKESFKGDPAQLDSLLAVFPLPAMGPSFYIPELWNHVIANIATRRKSAGYGLDRQALGL
jgi:hypothetical protein